MVYPSLGELCLQPQVCQVEIPRHVQQRVQAGAVTYVPEIVWNRKKGGQKMFEVAFLALEK